VTDIRTLFVLAQLDGPHVVRVEDAKILVEAVPGGIKLGLVSEVPLADARGGVAGGLEQLGQEQFARRNAEVVDPRVGCGVAGHATAERIPPGH
jgi:hypothetical protein